MAITINRTFERGGKRAPRQRRAAAGARCWPLLALLALPGPARASDWHVLPSVRLRESYSDNIHLAPPGQAKGDFVSEIAPAIALHASGARLALDVAYSLQQRLYARQRDTVTHELLGSGRAELLEDWLFLDARASISRHNISAFGPLASDAIARTDNQSSVRATSISPFLRHRLRGLASTEWRYTHSSVESGRDLLSSRSDALLVNLTGDDDKRGGNWDAHYDATRIDDAGQAPLTKRKASLTLRYPLGTRVGLFASAGHEREGYQATSAAPPQGRFWSLGASWRPSTRNSVTLSGGRRFFGDTYALDASHRSRNTLWTLGYSEDVSSTSGQFLRLSDDDSAALLDQLWRGALPDPLQRRQRIDNFLQQSQSLGPEAGAINYFSHRYFLQKQWRLSMAAVTPKSALVLGAALTRRSAQSNSGIDSALLPALELALQDQTRQAGAHAGWELRLSPRSSVSLSGAYTRIDALSAGRRDANLAFSAGFSHTPRPGVRAAIDLRRVRHSSNRGGDYRENALSATLTFQL